jgi:tetratricopeptide (TPR) repeat protein
LNICALNAPSSPIPKPLSASVNQQFMKSKLFYSEIESKIASNLQNAKKSIKVAVAWFTNPNLFNLLENLIDNNIEIEIILSDEKINFTNEKVNFQKFIEKNVTLKISTFPNLMHNKFCLIDNRILITGSYNWTLKAEKSNYENIIISTDEKLVDDFINYFDFLKNSLETIYDISKIKLNEYIDKKEIDIEIELIREEKNSDLKIEKFEIKNIYDDELNKAIDKAHLLYLNGEINESIEFTNAQLKKYQNIPEFYERLACCYWRLKDFEKQILFSQKIIELENDTELSLDAYNLLGIGYSNKQGGEQQSIFYYKKCIDKKPDEHSFYRNRAISYIKLGFLPNLPIKIRNNYKQKADEDMKKIIEISKNKINKDYQILYSEAIAHYHLGNPKLALIFLNKSLEDFILEENIFKKDKNELKEIKFLKNKILKEVK